MSSLIGTPLNKANFLDEYDAIVIGSGIGGLACASLLSQSGKKVIVLEQHYTAGGFTHTFQRKNYEWDVGIHYIGEVSREDSAMRQLFNKITDDKLKWQDMGEVYDRIFIGEKSFDFPKGKDNLINMLKKEFPNEHSAIDKYFSLLKEVNLSSNGYFMQKALPSFIAKIFYKPLTKKFRKYSSRTTKEVLDEITSDKLLKAVLTGQWGDYGLTPNDSSFAMHAILVKHYLGGGNYPVGGSSNIARYCLPTIQRNGGDVVVSAKVKKILIDNNQVKGVELENGKQIISKKVISGVGVINTINNLLNRDIITKYWPEAKIKEVSPSLGHVCLYIGIKESTANLKLKTPNLWLYKDENHDENIRDYTLGKKTEQFPVVYISFPSSKDPTWDKNHPGTSTIEMITLAPFDDFKKWSNTEVRKRGEDYENYKKELTDKLLQVLYKHFPQLEGKIDFCELSTPLSTKHYCEYEHGEIYGIDHGPKRFDQKWLRASTPIKGLYLTGQDIATAGVGGALAAGVLTCVNILGPLKSWKLIKILKPKKRKA